MKYHSRNDSFLLGQPSPIRSSNDMKTTGFYTPTHLEDTDYIWRIMTTHFFPDTPVWPHLPCLYAYSAVLNVAKWPLCRMDRELFNCLSHGTMPQESWLGRIGNPGQVRWWEPTRTLGASSQRRRQVVVQSCVEGRPYWTINGKSHLIYCEKTKFGIAAAMTSLPALPV